MDLKSTWIFYMALNGTCFMVTWTLFKNHLLEVGVTRNRRETMAIRTLTAVGFFYLPCVRIHMNRDLLKWYLDWLHMTSHYTSWHTTHDFGGVLGHNLGTLSFGLSQFHGHSSWLVCEVALTFPKPTFFTYTFEHLTHFKINLNIFPKF